MPLDHGRPRMLSEDEVVDLRREMQEASAWMRAELLRRRSPAEVVAQPDVQGDANAAIANLQLARASKSP